MGGCLKEGHQRVGFVSHSSQRLVNEVVLMDGDGGYGHGASVMMMVMLVVVVTKTSSARVSLVRLDSTSRFFWSSAPCFGTSVFRQHRHWRGAADL